MILPNDNVRVFAEAESVAAAATEQFLARALATHQAGQIFTCALSGGSTPVLMFKALARRAAQSGLPEGFWNSVHFFWSDERDVPPEHPESNYRVACETLLSKIAIPESNVHRIKVEAHGALRAAAAYEIELKDFFRLPEGRFPVFDLIFLGLGEDGHVASIFPGTEVIGEKTHLVAAPWVERFNAYRITLTLPVINSARCVIFLVTGKRKAGVLLRVLKKNHDLNRLPAQMISPRQGELLWLMDRDAAAGLPGCIISS